ncbi:MAG: SDR family NAD(P)-dependent oxidoreductase [Pseudomonadota bacterium]
MTEFNNGANALVIGATGGIGRALVDALAASGQFERVFATGRQPPIFTLPTVRALALDLTDESSIQTAIEHAAQQPISLAIVATGLLHDGASMRPEKTWRAISPDAMARAFAVNCTGPSLVLKHLLPTLSRDARSVVACLSARVGSIGDNRLGGWYAYRSSKAALNMMIKSASIELARTHRAAVLLGLHPGTVDTPLSKPFQANVPDEALFSPERAAEQLLAVLEGCTPAQSGLVLDWQGKAVPP